VASVERQPQELSVASASVGVPTVAVIVSTVSGGAHATLATSKVAGGTSPAQMTLPGDHKDWEWRRMSAHFESAICRSTRHR
jgi:hypothetical protein